MRVRSLIVALLLLLVLAIAPSRADAPAERRATAERYIRAVYSGQATTVADRIADDIILTYPIIQQIFGTPALRGRQAVLDFSAGFGTRHTNPRFTFHEAVVEGDRVVLVWSFGAVRASGGGDGEEESWGGITLIRFDDEGKVVAEIGEESDPGPWERAYAAGESSTSGTKE